MFNPVTMFKTTYLQYETRVSSVAASFLAIKLLFLIEHLYHLPFNMYSSVSLSSFEISLFNHFTHGPFLDIAP